MSWGWLEIMFKINKFDCDYNIVKIIDAWGDVSIIFGVYQQNLLKEVFNRTENFPKLCFSRQQFFFFLISWGSTFCGRSRDCLTNQNVNFSYSFFWKFLSHLQITANIRILDFLFVNWFVCQLSHFQLASTFLFSSDFDGKTQFSSLYYDECVWMFDIN